MTREEAIKILKDIRETDGTNHGIHAVALAMGIEALQAEPVKHGEWKYYNYSDINNPYCGYNECSICGQHEHIVHKFCPNCGAKMDKELYE